MKNRSSIKSLRKLCACVLLVSACGGRAVTIEGSAGSGATGDVGAGGAATGGVAGRANGGTGNVGRAGSGSAGVAAAGNTCGFTSCPAIACGPGTTPYYPPGACCPICQSNCEAPCPGVVCASGYELQQQPGECCPSCVPSATPECATGLQNYQDLRSQLVSKYKYGCTTIADCAVVATYNDCESGCAPVAIWSGAVDFFYSNLSGAALMDCAACGPAPPPCLIPPSSSGHLACNQGQCELDFVQGGPK